MKLPSASLGTVATATVAGALLLRHEHRTRQAADRLAAAALETLLNAIDANDTMTGAHVRRVATFALILGDAAGLAEPELRTVERVALFHDIGKIHEALYDIIHDDSALSPADREAIATHPQRGAQVLQPLRSFYPDLPEGVVAHHERWDGTGYPRGLRGERIPISARIVAIADTFDAVTHRRRYHDGESFEQGLAVIQEGRGTQFDPNLVDLFMLPPVFGAITKAARKMRSDSTATRKRSGGRREDNVPDVTFRWRPARRR